MKQTSIDLAPLFTQLTESMDTAHSFGIQTPMNGVRSHPADDTSVLEQILRGPGRCLLIVNASAPRTSEVQGLLRRCTLSGHRVLMVHDGQMPQAASAPSAPSPAVMAARPAPVLKPAPSRPRFITDIIPEARRFAEKFSLDQTDLDQAVTDPDRTAPGTNECTWYIRNGHGWLLAPDGAILSVMPAEQIHGRHITDGRSMRPTGGPARFKPASVSDLLQRATSAGLHAELGHGGHWKLTDDQGRMVTVPATPSDHRWAQNCIAEIRSRLGVDLSQT